MRVFTTAEAVKCGPAGVVENQCILVGIFSNKNILSSLEIRKMSKNNRINFQTLMIMTF